MLLLLVSFASAEGLPWECPAVDIPEDATIYRDTDGGLADTWRTLERAAEDYVASVDCTWTGTTTSPDSYTTETSEVCELPGVTITRTRWEYAEWYYVDYQRSIETLLVEGDTGETWTRLQLSEEDSSTWGSSDWSTETTLAAEWTGSVDGLPDDGWFSAESGSSRADYYERWHQSVETPDCSFSWSKDRYESYYGTEAVRTPDRLVSVTSESGACEEGGTPDIASLDGVRFGAVDPTTWARDAADADGDGYTATYDCDDTDPGRYPCLREIANDGIDQDCDGADLVDHDLDNDGVDGTDFGGADCDDTDRTVYPGADDTPGDGIDQDCDGADDVDADGDGYTADGDDDLADCDDTSSRTAPGWYDVPYDGVDQDCSGADTTDVDGDGFDAEAAGGPDCDDRASTTYPGAPDPTCDGVDQDCDGDPGECDTGDTGEVDTGETADTDTAADTDDTGSGEDPPLGCGAGAGAWLLLLPLLGARRRRPA